MASLQRIDFAPDLTDQVYQRLLDAIVRGELAPGARLTQEELAAKLDVSRQPVLQALRLLKKDGVVVEAGRRGTVVAPLDPELIARIYQVRSVLDGLAAREAARAGRKLDPSLIDRGRKAMASDRIAAMIEADIAFHDAVYAASGNPLIGESAGRHWHHIRRVIGAALQTAAVRTPVWDEHQAILEAINAGDADQAERLARRHCEDAGRALGARLTGRARTGS
jgi:DNA-binding GntR family transcriptional regulator